MAQQNKIDYTQEIDCKAFLLEIDVEIRKRFVESGALIRAAIQYRHPLPLFEKCLLQIKVISSVQDTEDSSKWTITLSVGEETIRYRIEETGDAHLIFL